MSHTAAPQSVAKPPQAQLMELLLGRWLSSAISTAAQLGIPDLLAGGPQSVAELAHRSNTHPQALYRLLRALAGAGLFEETHDGVFRLTPLGEPLRSGVFGSVRGFALMLGQEWNARPWLELASSVRTGEAAFPRVYGLPNFEYLRQNPDAMKIFTEAMTGISMLTIAAVLSAFDFSPFRTLVDVAGGHGTLLTSILQQYPKLRGVLFDMPEVVAGAGPVLERANLNGRCTAVGGDFFASVPEGADAYMLKHILHDWDDPRAAQILSNCRRAMDPRGRVLVVDAVLSPGNAPEFAKLIDLEMLVMTPGGRERTESEFRSLFESAGLHLERVVRTQSPFCIVEGVPA